MIISLLFYFMRPSLNKFMIISFIVGGIFSILYYFIEPAENEELETLFIVKNYLCSSIPLFCSVFIYASLETQPYILISKVDNSSDYHEYLGTTMAFMKFFMNIGKSMTPILVMMPEFIIDSTNDSTDNSNEMKINKFGLILPLCVIVIVAQFIFYHIQKSINVNEQGEKTGETEMVERDEEKSATEHDNLLE